MVSLPTCPICEKVLPATAVTESDFFPFCGERCRNVDLLRWDMGKYSVVDPMTPDDLVQNFEDEDGYE